MVASRDIQPGEVIFSEDPLAVGPNHTTLPCCLECLKQVISHIFLWGKYIKIIFFQVREGSYLCPNCNLPMCEEMCAFGEEHSKECEVFSKLEPKLSIDDYNNSHHLYWSITVIRALYLRDTDPKRYAIIARMMDHNAEHEKDSEAWNAYKENVVDFLRDKCGLADKYSREEIFHVLGALDVNSIKIHGSGTSLRTASSGHGLYGLTALLSHSCISNTKTQLKSDCSNECRATVMIPAGEEITKQYVSPLETTRMRRTKLREGWYFDCSCPRCVDPTEAESFTSATRCLRCGEGTILPINPTSLDDEAEWKCDTCTFVTTSSAVDKLVSYFTDKLANPMVVRSVEALEDLLEKSARLLHPNHYVVTLIRIKMNVAYIQLSHKMFCEETENEEEGQVPVEVYMRRKELLDDVQKVIDIVDPGLSRRRGLSLFETSTCHLQLGRMLYESERFPLDDFVQLLHSEKVSLEDAIACLADSREGTSEAEIHFRAECALHEAEVMIRLMEKKKEEKRMEANRVTDVTEESKVASDAMTSAAANEDPEVDPVEELLGAYKPKANDIKEEKRTTENDNSNKSKAKEKANAVQNNNKSGSKSGKSNKKQNKKK